jgi:hypothetical protein
VASRLALRLEESNAPGSGGRVISLAVLVALGRAGEGRGVLPGNREARVCDNLATNRFDFFAGPP